jgi:LytR cell envelope-related transcriptional attenuator
VRPQHWRRTRTLVIFAILMITATVVWARVFTTIPGIDALVGCTPAPVSARGETPIDYNGLNAVAPTPPDQVSVRVLNGSSQRGAARLLSAQFDNLGFQRAAPAADDPQYPYGNMGCVGQIRFGARGEGSARMLSLLIPCAQLVRDSRADASVDVSIGTRFNGLVVTSAAHQLVTQLMAWSQQHPVPPGGLLAHDQAAPPISASLLAAARPAHC